MMVNKVGSIILLLNIFLMGIVTDTSAQLTLHDFGLTDTADQQLQTPLYVPQTEDSADVQLNVDFQAVDPFSGYGVLGAVPLKNGIARVGNFTINRNVETTAVLFLKTFVLPRSVDYPMHTNFNTLDFEYAPPPGSPQLKLKIGN